ncbi:F-box protein At1g30790-like [Lycium ferocissimum]|uniref:F-box protein At1g30790-like n=1 Tax=Lycium ferocissimum TaxID=112874 RepID=UPI0028160A0E|nr:F-box protein At1g30790-like [Lycium ferocissimum]
MADHFPKDLLINIFLRLGVKQLCQLKCLSKEWLHTISSPHFKKQHRDQSKKRPNLSLISSSRSDDRSIRSQLIHLASIDSCNYIHECEAIAEIGEGHFVCSSRLDLLCFYQTGYEGKIWICNPITKKTLALPILSYFAGEACLGYVCSTNEYKMVASYKGKVKYVEGRVGDSDDWEFEADYEEFLYFNILTLKLEEETSVVGSWRDLFLSFTQYSGTRHLPIHIDGFIYWLAFAKDNSDQMSILGINLENEEVKTLCLPNGYSFGFSHLAEINGHLCLVQINRDSHMLNIWMLKAHESEGWCLEYSVEVHESASNFTIIGYLPRNNDSGDILIWSIKGNLYCYETDTKKFKQLQSLSRLEYKWCVLFYESFFSIGLPGN